MNSVLQNFFSVDIAGLIEDYADDVSTRCRVCTFRYHVATGRRRVAVFRTCRCGMAYHEECERTQEHCKPGLCASCYSFRFCEVCGGDLQRYFDDEMPTRFCATNVCFERIHAHSKHTECQKCMLNFACILCSSGCGTSKKKNCSLCLSYFNYDPVNFVCCMCRLLE
jgi:hypothetical protein